MQVKCLSAGLVLGVCVFLPCAGIAGVFEDNFDDNDIGDWKLVGGKGGEVNREDESDLLYNLIVY